MDVAVAAAVFPVIFLGELPDKTMFASLLLASRGRPAAVWVGAAGGFLVHVVIAVAAGGLLSLAPRRAVDAVVAVLFLGGAIYTLRDSEEHEEEEARETVADVSVRRTTLAAFGVIFLAEWGDLTQILTANLSARYHDPVSVAVGAVLALWAVAGIAVVGGRLLTRLPLTLIRRVTAAVLVILAIVAAVAAIRG